MTQTFFSALPLLRQLESTGATIRREVRAAAVAADAGRWLQATDDVARLLDSASCPEGLSLRDEVGLLSEIGQAAAYGTAPNEQDREAFFRLLLRCLVK